MSDKKIISVTGATGAQGGGLVRAILADDSDEYAARAITRNVESDKAKVLAAAGAEVVTADLDDVASLERAFEGAHGVFCLTNFWEHFSPEKETQQVANLAQAAKQAGVRHAIWSTLEDTRKWVPLDDDRMPTLMDSYKVPHFDAKGAANQMFIDQGVPTTFLLTSFYWENFIYFGMGPQKGPDGVYGITMPMGDKKLPGMATEDIGRCAFGIFNRGEALIGKTVGITGEHLTGGEMAAALTDALGFEVRYNDVPPEVYRGFDFPGAEDIGNMFQFNRDFDGDFRGARSIEQSRELNPQLQTFAGWLADNKDQIPIE